MCVRVKHYDDTIKFCTMSCAIMVLPLVNDWLCTLFLCCSVCHIKCKRMRSTQYKERPRALRGISMAMAIGSPRPFSSPVTSLRLNFASYLATTRRDTRIRTLHCLWSMMASGGEERQKGIEELEQEVTCPVCQDHFQDPKILPCLHYYCKQ